MHGDRRSGQIGDEIDAFGFRIFAEVLAQIAQHLQQVEGLFLFLDQFGIEPRGIGNVAHQTVEAAHVMFDHIQQFLALVVALDHAQRAHGRPERSERVLDLMGHIGGELFVAVDPVVERRDHAAQRARQAANLIRPRGQIGNADAAGVHLARVLVAAQFGGGREVGQRIGDGRGQNEAEADGDEGRDDENLQDALAFAAHKAVDLSRSTGHGDHADRGLALHDGSHHAEKRAAFDGERAFQPGAAGHASADHAAQLLFERRGGGDLIGAEGGRNPVPKPIQPVVQQGPLTRLGRGEGFGHGKAACGAGDQRFRRIIDKDFDAAAQIQPVERGSHIDTIASGQVHRRACGELGLDHIGDQLSLRHQCRGALQRQTVSRGIEVEDPRNQNAERDQVEGNDLARQRRGAEREQPPPFTLDPNFIRRGTVGGDPIVPQYNITVPASSHVPHKLPFDPR